MKKLKKNHFVIRQVSEITVHTTEPSTIHGHVDDLPPTEAAKKLMKGIFWFSLVNMTC